MTTETIGREELAAILERNGYHVAAADVLAGVALHEATAYVARSDQRYDDGEGRWLTEYVNELQREVMSRSHIDAMCVQVDVVGRA